MGREDAKTPTQGEHYRAWCLVLKTRVKDVRLVICQENVPIHAALLFVSTRFDQAYRVNVY